MQHKITKPSNLLNKHGELIQTGYATSPILKYIRKDVSLKHRLKEWDYYLIYNDYYAIALTVGFSIGMLLISTTFIDFHLAKEHTKSVIRIVPLFKMPESSQVGDIVYKDKEVQLSITHKDEGRYLSLYLKNFMPVSDLETTILLLNEPNDSMVIATPFKENKKYFYYNQKIIGMEAYGYVTIGHSKYSFDSSSSYGLLDWGRGVWPYNTKWYWSAAQGKTQNGLFGFNLGYGFGDTAAATENMLFLDGKASKITNVKFHIQKDSDNNLDYMKPWLITSSDKRIEMTMNPIIDRNANLSAVILSTNQHQVFGKFTGWAKFDDGTIVYIKDLLGFAEKVVNRW